MNITFKVEYKTVFGEELVLNIIGEYMGQKSSTQYRMNTLDGSHWYYDLHLHDNAHVERLDYFYSVERSGLKFRHEWTVETHRMELNAGKAKRYIVYDRWTDIPENSYYYSSAFTDCVRHRELHQPEASEFARTVRLVVRAPQLREGERLALIGSSKQLGAWELEKALPMTEHGYNEWTTDIDASMTDGEPLEFKFVAVSSENDVTSMWEDGHNRTIDLPELKDGDCVVYSLLEAHFDIADERIAGTLVPVFSLRSEGSFGVGDFGDLKSMIEFMSETGQRILQLLPVNDTTSTHTWTDSYPYSSISIFALHPQYVDFRQLPELKNVRERKAMKELQKELNSLRQIDYEKVNNAKIKYLRLLYAQEGSRVLKSAEYAKFFADSRRWLVPYAAYCCLRDKYGTADFSKWPDHKEWKESWRAEIATGKDKTFREAEFWYYVQYVLDSQLSAAHDYARGKHVILKGDIAIGVSRYGCDVWAEPRYFNLNGQAGAPPDDFSVNGQNWGFPTYNWTEMLRDGCQWWIRRFQNMARYFDAYRIDHVLGFFRIWEIPIDSVHGLLGQFQPALGLTREEIKAYGFNFQEERDTTPFITDWVLDRVFHERADEVREKYLDRIDDERYKMKPEYDTQRKVESAFAGVGDREELNLRDGLYALISDVLFVRDHNDSNKFHPRISVQFDFIYESLWDNDKTAFNRLYNDYYYRRNNQFWYREAMKKLPILVQATRMLVCAEDLGMVPACVPWVLDELRILSLEIQSMPKDSGVKFGHLSRNPYRSVCTISSHDMPTLRQWWDEDPARTQEYYNTMLYRGGEAPHPLPGWLARDIISRHLTSPSMLCILSIQDWLSMDEKLRLPDENAERINIPANPHHYWRYRMHLNIEDLRNNKDFVENIRGLLTESNRLY